MHTTTLFTIACSKTTLLGFQAVLDPLNTSIQSYQTFAAFTELRSLISQKKKPVIVIGDKFETKTQDIPESFISFAREHNIGIVLLYQEMTFELAKKLLRLGLSLVSTQASSAHLELAIKALQCQGTYLCPKTKALLPQVVYTSLDIHAEELDQQDSLPALLLQSLTLSEIGSRIGLSSYTIKDKVGDVYNLVGVRNRYEYYRKLADAGYCNPRANIA